MSARARYQPWFESPLTRARRRLSEIGRAMRESGTEDGYALWYEYVAFMNQIAEATSPLVSASLRAEQETRND